MNILKEFLTLIFCLAVGAIFIGTILYVGMSGITGR